LKYPEQGQGVVRMSRIHIQGINPDIQVTNPIAQHTRRRNTDHTTPEVFFIEGRHQLIQHHLSPPGIEIGDNMQDSNHEGNPIALL